MDPAPARGLRHASAAPPLRHLGLSCRLLLRLASCKRDMGRERGGGERCEGEADM